jgi:uncharacterized metal-binding protein
MPMGMTHRQINTYLNIPLGAGAILLGWQPLSTVAMLAGYNFATYFMNPDLDLQSDGYNSWGPLRFIWWPYQKALAHRSWTSHMPIISTILRIMYLFWLPFLLFALFWSSMSPPIQNQIILATKAYWVYAAYFVVGMVISDTVHAILDISSTELKERGFFRKKRRHASGLAFLNHHGEKPRQNKRRPSKRRYY